MDEVLERYPRQRLDVAARVIEGEAVVVTPADSLVHELDPVATFVWERCDGSLTGAAIADAMTSEFEVDLEQARVDLADLLRTLRDRGLIDLLERHPG